MNSIGYSQVRPLKFGQTPAQTLEQKIQAGCQRMVDKYKQMSENDKTFVYGHHNSLEESRNFIEYLALVGLVGDSETYFPDPLLDNVTHQQCRDITQQTAKALNITQQQLQEKMLEILSQA